MAIADRSEKFKIPSTYFDEVKYNHSEKITPHLEAYSYGVMGMLLAFDLTDRLMDYSYDCDSKNDIRQSANVSVYIGNWFDFQPVRWEHRAIDWVTKKEGEEAVVFHSVSWNKYLYKMYLEYECADTGEKHTLDFGWFSPASSDYQYDASTSVISISLLGLSSMLTSEYGGGILGTTESYPKCDEHGVPMRDEQGNIIYNTYAHTQSLGAGSSLNNSLIEWILNPKWENDSESSMNISDYIPIEGVVTEVVGCGVMMDILPTDLDFDTNVSRMDMIRKVIETCYIDGSCWIDEGRILHVGGRQEKRRYSPPVAYWRELAPLVISHDISTDDSGFYNIVEVFGKDGEYYACADYSYLDSYIRKTTMTFDELQSNDECMQRAEWEAYKARFGHENVNAKLVNRYIAEFQYPSNKVGRTIEFTTSDGATNLFWLDKISFSGSADGEDTISLSMTVFDPLYNTKEQRWTDTLAIPYIESHEVIDKNTVRLYIAGEDIDYGAARLYDGLHLRYETVSRDENGRMYADIKIDHTGRYEYTVNLYSPYYETSGFGGEWWDSAAPYVFEATYEPPELPVDPYPHPHADPSENSYLTNETRQILTDESGRKIHT